MVDEVDGGFAQKAITEEVTLAGLVHDHAFTNDWYVAAQSPLTPKPIAALSGSKPLWAALQLSDKSLAVWLVPRGRSGDPICIDVPTDIRVAFHVVNAFDDGEDVVVDIVGYEGRVSFESAMPSARSSAQPTPTNRILRLRLNPMRGSRSVGRLDVTDGTLTTWDAGDGHQFSPPAFAPDHASETPKRVGFSLGISTSTVRQPTS